MDSIQTPLTLDAIAALLGDNSIRPKPRQAGPLKYITPLNPQVCSVCNVQCMIEVNGRAYCSTHAIYALNKAAMGMAIPNECTCEAGKKTMFSLHTADCTVYERLPE